MNVSGSLDQLLLVSVFLYVYSAVRCVLSLWFTPSYSQTSVAKKAACLLEQFPPPSVCLYIFILSLSTSCFDLFMFSHTLLLWPHYVLFFFMSHTHTRRLMCLMSLLFLSLVLFCFLFILFPFSSLSFSNTTNCLSLSLPLPFYFCVNTWISM